MPLRRSAVDRCGPNHTRLFFFVLFYETHFYTICGYHTCYFLSDTVLYHSPFFPCKTVEKMISGSKMRIYVNDCFAVLSMQCQCQKEYIVGVIKLKKSGELPVNGLLLKHDR